MPKFLSCRNCQGFFFLFKKCENVEKVSGFLKICKWWFVSVLSRCYFFFLSYRAFKEKDNMQFADRAPKNENIKFSRTVLKMLTISQFCLSL